MSTTTVSYTSTLKHHVFESGEQLTARPQAASRLRRMGAFAIDVLVYGALTSVFTFILSLLGTSLASLLYAAFHDNTVGSGRSLGRAAVNHRLLHTDGRAVSHGTAIARNVLRWLMWTTLVLFVVDLVLFFTSGRLIADHIMGTQVCEDPSEMAPVLHRLDAEVDQTRDVDVIEAEREIAFERRDFAEDQLKQFDEKLSETSVFATVERRR
ncbi:MAG: hypothetical protein AAFX99_08075 [Myxococcota bacterium]